MGRFTLGLLVLDRLTQSSRWIANVPRMTYLEEVQARPLKDWLVVLAPSSEQSTFVSAQAQDDVDAI